MDCKTVLLIVVAAHILGCASSLPKSGPSRWVVLDNNPSCKIQGSWERYTWTGPCVNGIAEGVGTVKGFAGSKLMFSYSGEMKNGTRNGQGIAHVEEVESPRAPVKVAGIFQNGRLKDGTMTYYNSDGSSDVKHFENLVYMRDEFVPASQTDVDSSSSIANALLAAATIATGVASSNYNSSAGGAGNILSAHNGVMEAAKRLDEANERSAAVVSGSGSGSGSGESSFNYSKYMPGSQCEKDLSYLAPRLKVYNVEKINNIRSEIIRTNLNAVMLSINRMGLSPDEAIQQSLQQAEEHDKTAREAWGTAQQSHALSTTDDGFEADMRAGRVTVSDCSGIHESSLCVAIVNKYGAIGSRALAANLMCYKNANKWAM